MHLLTAQMALRLALMILVTSSLIAGDDYDDLDQIVGGKEAKPGAYPFLAVLITRSGGATCGGSLVTSTHVLTAAHCVDYLKPTDWSSLVILINATSINPVDRGAIKRGISKIVRHRAYNPETSSNDVAVITLDSPVYGIRPVLLPTADNFLTYEGFYANVIGFGRTDQTLADQESQGSGSNVLKETTVRILSNRVCSSAYEKRDSRITASMLCASSPNTDACQGDSGGPLLVGRVQVGVVSWGYGCADPNFPGVYSRVSHFLPWIKANII